MKKLALIFLFSIVGFAQQPLPNGTGGIAGTLPVFQSTTFASLPTSAPTGYIYNVTNVGVNGSLWMFNGTKWAPLNGRLTLMQSGMPWILLGSGSVAANGAISGLTTALPFAYTKAWCYFPANIVAAVAAAGWRYCTWSSTTAGTAFLDQPSSSFPVVWPTSTTAVTAGQGAYTGQSGGTLISTPSITVPGNAMGINGRLEMKSTTSISAGSSSVNSLGLLINSACGAASSTNSNPSTLDVINIIANRGAANRQTITSMATGNATTSNATTSQCTVNTANALTITGYFQPLGSTATINQIAENFVIELYNDGQ